MTLLPDPWWLSALLAAVLLGDALLSLRPPQFIRRCLDGVGLPRDWWWILVVIKLAAVVGLVAGLWVPGIALATTCAVICYFLAAVAAHVRARFLGRELWINCLGMLALAVGVLVLGHLV
ncbi:DoxX family protein [Brachybacterium hainanense]|uniref:DoxX family protein n=1 Tax=Brachybacterium hainanense TaxID=1541174 RepID=A0ABV6R6W5_9MICO